MNLWTKQKSRKRKMKTRQAEDQHLDYDTNKSVNIRYNEFLNEHELQSHWLHWTPRETHSTPSLKVSPMLGSCNNFSGVEVDLLLRIEWVLLLAALSLKMAARDATNSFLGLAMVKKLGTRDVWEWFPSERNLSDRLGLVPPISS